MNVLEYLDKHQEALPVVSSSISFVAGALLTAITTWLLAFINKRHQEDQHIRSLAIQLAIEDCRQHNQHQLEMAKVRAGQNQPWSINSVQLEGAVIKMLSFCDTLKKQKKLIEGFRRWQATGQQPSS